MPLFPRGIRTARSTAAVALAGGALLTVLTETPAVAQPHGPAFTGACPAAGVISQDYHSGHDGLDIANSRGTPLYAADAGTVTHSGTASGYGQWIRIRHADGSVTEYGHMYERFVAVGDTVTSGQRIASMGSEGQSTGPHLHFEVHIDGGFGFGDNPHDYMAARGVGFPC
ncbi:M23 family metallopeptidase [Streptomyces sp. DSM 42041]|uniref:M23 family metallopeptidase n=1 Tax=Streptomyces hazeniae TaxID=3075538 RepID=A0ABU2P207_9ACTN|nr:M23 family metallopeptidase [Streptomyces sp. DSM 42041]MDT0381948.1 M23 family metallopeptidase [Streptomyces sp. DSM 42041]